MAVNVVHPRACGHGRGQRHSRACSGASRQPEGHFPRCRGQSAIRNPQHSNPTEPAGIARAIRELTLGARKRRQEGARTDVLPANGWFSGMGTVPSASTLRADRDHDDAYAVATSAERKNGTAKTRAAALHCHQISRALRRRSARHERSGDHLVAIEAVVHAVAPRAACEPLALFKAGSVIRRLARAATVTRACSPRGDYGEEVVDIHNPISAAVVDVG